MRIIALLAILFLSACSSTSKEAEDFACPKVGFIAGADSVSIQDGGALINGFSGSCHFSKKPDQAVVELTLPFTVKMTKPYAGKELTLPYFIAVLSPEEEILQRQSLTTTIVFDNDMNGSSSEEHKIKIPVPSPAEAYKYKVAFGFILTPPPVIKQAEPPKEKPKKKKTKHKERK